MTVNINTAKSKALLGADILICLILVITTLSVYWQVRSYEFVRYDDPGYVYDNSQVQAGLTRESISWAFTTFCESNWHPLTWLSLMLDQDLYGMNPGQYHFTNVLLHLVNTVLLYLLFRRLTGKLWQSGFIAGLFALHPLHVESVAWVAERKDVLSTFFWLLTMWGYVKYSEKRSAAWYLTAIVFYVLGLMAKPMLVTLPFVLLLLDWWPLRRLNFGFQNALSRLPETRKPKSKMRQSRSRESNPTFNLLWEKLPFFILSGASCILTFYVQSKGGAVVYLSEYPFKMRIANVVVSYAVYLWKMVYPTGLAVLYPPYPGMQPWWKTGISGLLFVGITIAAVKAARRYPYMLFGWLWYVGTLVPVIGLVQIGSHARADRYTYVPLIGIFVIIAWGMPEVVKRWRYRRFILISGGLLVTSALVAMTWIQVGYWQNSVTLFQHTLAVTKNNPVIHTNLGNVLDDQGRSREAIEHFTEALRIDPLYANAHYNMGVVLAKQGRFSEAVRYYTIALKIFPKNFQAHNDLGIIMFLSGNIREAIFHFQEALRIRPDSANTRDNLRKALAAQQIHERQQSQTLKQNKIESR